MLDPSVRSITIVGPGLLGCSLGLALRAGGYDGRIIGVARRASTLETAIARGGIDMGLHDLPGACAEADLVVLCTPVCTVLKQIDQLATTGCNAVVTDVGSTKASIVEAAAGRLRRFVGSHPMAGAETTGPEAAFAELYRGKPCIITPTQVVDADALRIVEQLWSGVQMVVHRMDPAAHDRTVARISHLPHAVSVMLMQMADRGGGLEVASSGLADMTRIAAGDVAMWTDIFMDNREAVADTIDHLTGMLDAWRDMLHRGDREAITKFLTAARDARLRWRPVADQTEAESP